MIYDHISNADTYTSISEGIKKGLDYLVSTDLENLEVGKYEIDGSDVFVLIQEYLGKEISDANCEAHKNYIDIQYIIAGEEYIGYAPVEGMEVIVPYDEAKDRYFVKWDGTLLTYTKGMFSIFFPSDAHMPGVEKTSGIVIKKAVVKIKI